MASNSSKSETCIIVRMLLAVNVEFDFKILGGVKFPEKEITKVLTII